MERKRRSLPRHVDGRIMIFALTLKNFLIVMGVIIAALLILVPLFNATKSPVVLMVGIALIGAVWLCLAELNNKERGIDLILGIIRYKSEGNLYYERGNKNETKNFRFTWNKIESSKDKADF